LLVACASGRTPGQGNDVDAAKAADAKEIDSPVEQFTDAAIDAPKPPPDAPPDAPPPQAVDAPPDACVPQMSQLLVNPVFDLTPMGTGWTETRIDQAYPLVTDQDGIAEHSAPYKVWLGGFEAPITTVTDIITQDVAIPPLTTQLVLTGFRDVKSSETTTSTMYDTAVLSVRQTSGAVIANILSLSNLDKSAGNTAVWTPINHTFAQNLSGQTVRIHITSSNDFSLPSSFFYDTFTLTATHGCP
jgi:hypothetical protein